MREDIVSALYLQIPIIFGGVWHMFFVKRDWLARLRSPVLETAFGANKTWRGMLLVPALSGLGASLLWPLERLFERSSYWWASPLAGHSLLLAGLIGGIGYVVAELPNSFLKRRLGVAPGATPERGRHFFIMLDQVDSGIGSAAAYSIYPGISMGSAIAYVALFPFVALLVKRLLFWGGLKMRPS